MSFTPRAGRAVISMGVDGAASSRKDIDSVGDSLRKVNNSSFTKLSGQVSSVQAHLGGLKSSLVGLAQLSVAGITVGAFTGMIRGAVDAADNLNDLSKATGVAIGDLAGLKLAAEQSGANVEVTAKSLNKLALEMSKNSEKFAALGITAKEPLEAFKQLADVFSSVEDQQTRAALGTMALGKSWQEVAPLLAEGGDRIGAMIDKGRDLAGVTQELADRADAFNDSMAELGTAVESAKMRMANDMVPALTAATNAIVGAYEESGKLQALWVGMGALGSFLFTDDFSSAAVKLKNLNGELEVLQHHQWTAKNQMVPLLGYMLWGDEAAWDAEIEQKKREIEEFKRLMTPPAQPLADPFGDRFMASVTAYGVNKVLGDKEDDAKRAAAARKAADEARRQADAYTALTSSIKARVAETERELAGLAPLNEAEKLHIELTERLLTGKLKLSPVQKAEYEDRIKVLGVNLKQIEAQKASNLVHEATAKMLKGLHDASEKSIADATEEATKNEELARTFGMTTAAIAQLEVARLEEQLAQRSSLGLTLDEIEVLEQLIVAKRRSADAISSVEGQEARRQANEAMTADWSRTVERYEDVFRDGFANMLNKGKDGWKSFTRSLATTFKTSVADQLYKMFAQPFVMKLVANVLGITGGSALSTAASAATTVGGSTVGGAVGGVVGGLFGAGGMAGSLAAGAGWLTGATTLGGSLTAGASLVGTGTLAGGMAGAGMIVGALAPIALGIAAAVAIWKKLDTSGTYHAGGAASANSSGVSAVTAGSLNMERIQTNDATQKMVGELASGVVKILDSTAQAFGKTAGYTAATAFADDTSKDGAWGSLVISKMGQSVVNWQDTRGNGSWSQKTFADGEAGQEQYLRALSGSVRTALDDIGLPTWARSMLDNLGNGPAIEDLAKVIDTINATQRALTGMGEKLVGFAGLSGAATSALMTAAGGIEALSANASVFYDKYYTAEEKSAGSTKRVAEALQAVGLAMPATQAEFRRQVEASLALGEAGAPAAAALLSVAGAFADLHPGVAETTAVVIGATNTLAGARDALTEAYERESDAIKATSDRMGAFASSLRGLRDSALLGNLSPLTPQQKYAEARSQYEAVLAASRSGDQAAQGRYQEAYTAFLTASQLVNASGSVYQRDFAYAQSATNEAITWAEQQVDVSRASLDALTAQVSGLITVNASVMGVTDAVNALSAAMGMSGAASHTSALESLYQSLLGRSSDAEGLKYWEGRLAGGSPIAEIASEIGNSPERAQFLQSGVPYQVNYAAMGTSSMTPLVEEIKALRISNEALLAETKQLRVDATEQTIGLIQSGAVATRVAAEKMASATLEVARIHANAGAGRVSRA